MSDAANLPLDLDGIERDLADVEVALARLDAGTSSRPIRRRADRREPEGSVAPHGSRVAADCA